MALALAPSTPSAESMLKVSTCSKGPCGTSESAALVLGLARCRSKEVVKVLVLAVQNFLVCCCRLKVWDWDAPPIAEGIMRCRFSANHQRRFLVRDLLEHPTTKGLATNRPAEILPVAHPGLVAGVCLLGTHTIFSLSTLYTSGRSVPEREKTPTVPVWE